LLRFARNDGSVAAYSRHPSPARHRLGIRRNHTPSRDARRREKSIKARQLSPRLQIGHRTCRRRPASRRPQHAVARPGPPAQHAELQITVTMQLALPTPKPPQMPPAQSLESKSTARDSGPLHNSENPKYRLPRRANQRYKLAPSRPEKRGVGHRHERGLGMRWTQQRRRETELQGG
jgi:hypothetical protein